VEAVPSPNHGPRGGHGYSDLVLPPDTVATKVSAWAERNCFQCCRDRVAEAARLEFTSSPTASTPATIGRRARGIHRQAELFTLVDEWRAAQGVQ
jgi:hypothetical protein